MTENLKLTNKLYFLISLALFGGFCQCSTPVAHSETITFTNETWDVTQSAKFNVEIIDTIDYYTLKFLLRHSSAYPYANLFLLVQTITPDGSQIKDTVEYLLADSYGKWLGDKGSNLWNCVLPYRKEIIFPVKGTYSVTVTHGMRVDKLSGITDISLLLKKDEETDE